MDKAGTYAIAIGIILLLGGICLSIANPLNMTSTWHALAINGAILIIVGIVIKVLKRLDATSFQGVLCPNLNYRIVPLPQLNFTRENVVNAIDKLKKDLGAITIQVADCDPISALALLEKMNGIQSNKAFLEISMLAAPFVKRVSALA